VSAPHADEHSLTEAFALGATVAIGAMLAAQTRINGALGKHTGAIVAAVVSFAVGLALLTVSVAVSSRARAGFARLRRTPVRRWWYFGGVAGAAVVASSAAAAPEVGVSLVTVLVVAGMTAGGLAVDAAGLGPSGRVPANRMRVAGTLLAIVAVSIGAIGQHGTFRPGLLALVGVAGVAGAGQQAANGQLRAASGDARVAAFINFAVGLLALLLLAVVVGLTGHLPAIHWPGDPWLYVGGLLGVVFIGVSAALVARLGVLRLTLGTVSGQVVGALVIDAIAPSPGLTLTAATVVGAALTLVAVAVTVRGR
jgi:transporter family-2 protein